MDHPAYQSQLPKSPTPGTVAVPEQPVKPSGRNLKKWIIIGGAILIILLTGTAYILSQQKDNNPVAKQQPAVTKTSPTPASNAADADPTADWKTYTNTKYSYSFEYPGSLSVVESAAGAPSAISVGYISQEQLNTMGITYCGANLTDARRCETITVNETTNIQIDWGTKSSKTNAHIPHPNGGIVTLTQNTLETEDERKVFRAILFSFKHRGASKSTDPQTACEDNGGKWLSQYKECEAASGGLDEKTCKELGGTFNACDSACRHDPNPNACIEVCISVCKF